MKLSDLKVGDKVILHSGYGSNNRYVRVVSDLTDKYVRVGVSLYSKKNGLLRGQRERWNVEFISIPREGEVEEVSARRCRSDLRSKVVRAAQRLIDVEKHLSDSDLSKVLGALNEAIQGAETETT